MAVGDWEFQYNGLKFGGTNPIGVLKVEGLSPPDSDVDDEKRMDEHGSFVYAKFLGSRRITIQGELYNDGSQNLSELIDDWRSAFLPQAEPLALNFKIPGEEQKLIWCVPTRRSFPYDQLYSYGYCQWALEFIAEDPRIYSSIQYMATGYPISTEGFGIDFPIDFPINFGGGTGAALPITTYGIFPTHPVVTIYGPITNPHIYFRHPLTATRADMVRRRTRSRRIAPDVSFLVDIALGSNEYLVIDPSDKTVMLNGETSRYTMIREGSKWFELYPGTSDMTLRGSATSSNTRFRVSWRSAWI